MKQCQNVIRNYELPMTLRIGYNKTDKLQKDSIHLCIATLMSKESKHQNKFFAFHLLSKEIPRSLTFTKSEWLFYNWRKFFQKQTSRMKNQFYKRPFKKKSKKSTQLVLKEMTSPYMHACIHANAINIPTLPDSLRSIQCSATYFVVLLWST